MLAFMKKRMCRAQRRHRAMLQRGMLQAMDERMLRDIGISRAEIDRADRRVRWIV